MVRISVLVGLYMSLCGSLAAEDWIEVRSPHFTVLSDARRGKAWTVADEFERIRTVFATALSDVDTAPARPLLIFAVRDEQGFRELMPGLGELLPAGVFVETSGEQRIVLRLDATGDSPFNTLYHEYHHVLLRARGERPLPSWVVEGLAEFWSQAVIRTHEVELGNPDNSHLRFLQNEPMMPLDELLRIYGYRHDTERRALRTLYAQSWALTHWILLGDGTGTGQAKLDRYLELLAGGSDSVEAFVDLFGPLEEVESNLKRYARQSMFPAMRIPAPEQSDEPFEIRPLSASESAGHKADFLIAMGQNEAARRVLERGAAPEGSERLGVLAFESSEYDEATRWFDDAVRNGTATFLSYYYRALLANERGDHAMAVAELERSIELESRFTPALLELASHYARDPERRERASELLERAVELTPADRLALAELGRKLLEFGRPEEARKVLERMLALPPVPGSKAIARALEEAIERFEAR